MIQIERKAASVSPLTGKEYPLPAAPDDRNAIDSFMARHPGKPVVAVQGLGFVGAVMSLVCANALHGEYAVLGVDLANENTYWKIRSINEGRFPIIAADPRIEELYQEACRKGNLLATFDPYAYAKADVVIVDINLDVDKKTGFYQDLEGYHVDLSNFKKAIRAIGDYCREDVLVLVETTVPPGTCAQVVQPILSECLAARGLATDRFRLGHSYERVMPGPGYIDSIQNFYRVFSGVDRASAEATEAFLRTIINTDHYPLSRLGNTSASEMAKVLENSYRAMNIAFMVEWSRFAEEAGVNLYEVVQAIRMRPTHSNMMFPGIGVGGYCLPKDPLLASWSRRNLFDSPEALYHSELGVQINDKMPLHAFQFMQREYGRDLYGKKVVLLGVSYRSDVGDTRYSPVEPFYNYLLEAGCEVFVHDPHVPYWEEKGMKMAPSYEPFFHQDIDLLIIGTPHSDYRRSARLMSAIMNQNELFVLDTVGIFTEPEIQQITKKHTLRVLGRGDIQK